MEDLKPCPFCGRIPRIAVCDDEGNLHHEEYENDPWSGLGYLLEHVAIEENDYICPVATFEDEPIGTRIYDSREEAINAWNRRV
jgi:hypothetical protein